MARISLRDYNREIEELVDSGRTDEAIAHCRYILETYPKNINTYRSLGKALLESQRYGDAADVFKRVLACIPDDFIAHLGMSIIREDEGDLDGSIWHMERAFEVQPSNAAVQAELRRLYGRRDGLTPAKVQLTRGAMARMSAKSHLYSQAIAEVRTALADDPQRPDLQALLARMYAQTGQRLAAIETCNALLGKFPYCLEANRLMVEILPGTERASETETYRRRLEELDPYEAHISPAATTAEQVQAGVITMERLDYLDVHAPVEIAPAQPQWASSLGVSIEREATSDEPLPDWLSTTSESPALGEQEASAEPQAGSEIPDWMREAGWEPTSGETAESLPGFEAFDEEVGSGELAHAEIPDWLQDLAPEEGLPSETPPPSVTPELSEVAAKAAILAADSSEGQSGFEEPTTGEQLPVESETFPKTEIDETEVSEVTGESGSVLAGAEGAHILGASLAAGAVLSAGGKESQEGETEEAAQPESPGEPAEEELPDWLAPTAAEVAMRAESESLPDWLVTPPEDIQPVEPEAELPDWLKSEEEIVPESDVAGLAAASMVAAEFLEESETPTSAVAEPEASEPAPEEIVPQGVAGWLAESAPEAPPESEIGEIEEEQVEGIPEWLAQLSPEATTETSAAFVVETADQDTSLAQAEIPQWLREMESSPVSEVEEVAEAEIQELPSMEIEGAGLDAGEIPDWLKAAMAIETADRVIEPLIEEPEPVKAHLIEGDTKPVRIYAEPVEATREESIEVSPLEIEHISEMEALEEVQIEQVEGIEPEEISPGEVAEIGEITPLPEEAALPGFDNEEEAMAWLESLASRQGALEEELLTTPEERPVETPEWIQQFVEEPIEAEEILEEEKEPEEPSGIAKLAGMAAAGLAAKHVLDEEVTEEPVPVTPLEEIQEGAAVEQVEVHAEEAIEGDTETPEEAGLAEAEEIELPEWLRGIEAEGVTAPIEAEAEEWLPPAELAALEIVAEQASEAPRLDINKASLAQLERIPGIGFIIAQSIVAYREVNGPFTSLDQLQEIPGVTPETSEELKQNLFVEEIEKATPPPPSIPELELAWQNIANGNIPVAVDQYSYFIRQEQHLDEIITEIQEAVIIYPLDPLLYQTLGDAFLRANRLQEAMEAYNRAEDLLK